MDMKIGQEIGHGGEKFTIVDINHKQTPKGKILHIMAYDPDMANEEDQKRISVEEMNNDAMKLLRQFLSKGNQGGGFMFPMGS